MTDVNIVIDFTDERKFLPAMELSRSSSLYYPICKLDDDIRKEGAYGRDETNTPPGQNQNPTKQRYGDV